MVMKVANNNKSAINLFPDMFTGARESPLLKAVGMLFPDLRESFGFAPLAPNAGGFIITIPYIYGFNSTQTGSVFRGSVKVPNRDRRRNDARIWADPVTLNSILDGPTSIDVFSTLDSANSTPPYDLETFQVYKSMLMMTGIGDREAVSSLAFDHEDIELRSTGANICVLPTSLPDGWFHGITCIYNRQFVDDASVRYVLKHLKANPPKIRNS